MDYEVAEKEIEEMVTENKGPQVLQKVVDYLCDNFEKYSWIGIYTIRGNNLILGPWKRVNKLQSIPGYQLEKEYAALQQGVVKQS